MNKLPTTHIYGYPISRLGMNDTVQLLSEWVESGVPHHAVTINPIMIMDALEKPLHHATMMGADMLVPDGTGVVWAAGYLKQPVAERVPGFDLMHQLFEVADQKHWHVFLLGTSEDTIRLAAEKLKSRYSGAIFHHHHGYFTSAEDAEVIEQVRKVQPHLLFVARSSDLQDPWIHQHREALGVPVMMGVGGCFDIIAGKLKRAPKLWQKLHLEWAYRLLQEPSRYKRMLVLPRFVVKVIRDHEKRT